MLNLTSPEDVDVYLGNIHSLLKVSSLSSAIQDLF